MRIKYERLARFSPMISLYIHILATIVIFRTFGEQISENYFFIIFPISKLKYYKELTEIKITAYNDFNGYNSELF